MGSGRYTGNYIQIYYNECNPLLREQLWKLRLGRYAEDHRMSWGRDRTQEPPIIPPLFFFDRFLIFSFNVIYCKSNMLLKELKKTYYFPTSKALKYISAFPSKNLKCVVVIIVGIQFCSLFPLINIQVTSPYGYVFSIITFMIAHQSSL